MSRVQKKSLHIMFLGTGSDVGKSLMAAGFCRILRRRGYSVAPFKAQNMALNSFVTAIGEEMGRAQVVQAQAAGIQPSADMNPILLKPAGESCIQVIVQGSVYSNTDAGNYYDMKEHMLDAVLESHSRLAEKYDAIVLEGAGSTAEVNLRDRDIVNMEMALRLRTPAVIVADIDRGGVFASIIGTMKLLTRRERGMVIGFIINKFRGDRALFEEGIRIIEKKTRRPVFGLVPFFSDITLPEEDSVALQYERRRTQVGAEVRIAVVYLPHISNYTDFDPFEFEKGVSLSYIRSPEEIQGKSAVILPGTKNTILDLLWLKKRGFIPALRRHVENGGMLIGICGGYQMLGSHIADPHGIETNRTSIQGLHYFDAHTVLEKKKTLTQVRACCNIPVCADGKTSLQVDGYEIHMGRTEVRHSTPAFFVQNEKKRGQNRGEKMLHPDGAVSENSLVWGTYLHGLFENDRFRYNLLKSLGRGKYTHLSYRKRVETMYDRLADIIEENVDVPALLKAALSF